MIASLKNKSIKVFLGIPPTLPKTVKEIGWNLLFIVIYFFAGKLGLIFASVNPHVSVIWPPTGIALATIILFGYKFWPGILIGAFLTNLTTGSGFSASCLIALGNTLEAVVAGYAINAWAHGKYAFDKIRSTLMFSMFVALACTLAATIGVSGLIFSGLASTHDAYTLWFTWWLGDMGGAFILTPLIILWVSSHRHIVDRYQIPELIVATSSLLLSGQIVFDGLIHSLPINYPFPFLIVPPMLWLALRFKRRLATIGMLMVTMIAIHGTLQGFGPFGALDPSQSLLVLQMFLVVTIITVLLVISLVAERAQAYKSLWTKERHFHALIEKSSSGIVLLNEKGNITYVSSAVQRLTGHPPHELLGRSGINFLYPSDTDISSRAAQAELFSDFLKESDSRSISTEIRFRHNDHAWIWIESTSTNLLSDPDIRAIVVNFHDITERKQLREKKNQFLSLVSHELYIPLEAIRKYAATLLENKNQRTTLEQTYIQEINRSSAEMTRQVDNLLKIFRIEVGMLEIKPRSVKLRLEVEEALQRVSRKLTAKKITLEKSFVLQGTIVNLDPFIFTSILATFMSEVITHIPSGGTLVVEIVEYKKSPAVKIVPLAQDLPESADLLVAKLLATYMGINIIYGSKDSEKALIIALPAPVNPS